MRDLNLTQIRILNEKLDETHEKPRNRSEPRKRFVASPDMRPEALEEADEEHRQALMAQI